MRLSLCLLVATVGLPQLLQAQAPVPFKWKFNSIGAGEAIAYSPDGSLIAVGGPGGAEIYNAATARPVLGLPSGWMEVKGLGFSHDGKTLAVASTVGLQLWRVTDGVLLATLPTVATTANACVYSQDGTKLAVAGVGPSGGVLELWDASSRTKISTLATSAGHVESLAFTPDGLSLVSGGAKGSAGTLEVWTVSTGALVTSLNTSAVQASALSISPDGKTLAVGGNGTLNAGSKLELWNLPTRSRTTTLPTGVGSVTALAFTPDGGSLEVGGNNVKGSSYGASSSGQLELWAISSQIRMALTNQSNEVLAFAFAPNGLRLAVGGTNSMQFPTLGYWAGALQTFYPTNLVADAQIGIGGAATVSGFSPPAFSSDGKSILGGAFSSPTTGTNLWDAASGQWKGGVNGGMFEAFSPDGKSIAVGYDWNTAQIQFWDSTSLTLNTTLSTAVANPEAVAFSPDGTKLAVGGLNLSPYANVVQVLNLSTGLPISSLVSAANGGSMCLAFASDNTTLAISGQVGGWTGIVELWNASTGTKLGSLGTNENNPLGLAFSPDGVNLAIAGQRYPFGLGNPYGDLELWTVATRAYGGTLQIRAGTGTMASPVFTSDGKSLYVASDLGIQVFSVATKKLLGYFGNPAEYLAISPDGSQLAFSSTSNDLTVGPIPAIQAYPVASLSVNPSVFAAGKSAVGTVGLNSVAPSGGVTIGLYSTFMGTVPASVWVAPGAKTTTFPITTYAQQAQTTMVITASSGPYYQTASVNLTPYPPVLSTLTATPSSVLGGNTTQGSLTVASAILGAIVPVYLSSNNPAVTVENSVPLFKGNTTSNFSIWSNPVSAPTIATVTAILGTSTLTTSVTVLPATISKLSLAASSLQGGKGTTGTVAINGAAGKQGIVVALTSTSTSVTMPASVTVPYKATQSNFNVSTTAVDASVSATLTATTGTVSQTATLAIAAPQLLSMVLAPTTVNGGASTELTVKLNGPAGPNGAVVTLSSSSSVAHCPASLTIPAGKTSWSVSIGTSTVTANTSATITAAYSGSTLTATVTINNP